MRLVKLLAYSLLSYVLYELYLGMTEGAKAESIADAPVSAPRRPSTRGGTKGKTVNVQDAGGGTATRSVGRGALH